MANCLGIYIEDNLIKYAKVSKEKEMLKVDAFGVKFYDQIGPAINQIISETYSYKTPISINLSEETYQYFYFFNLLNKKDLKKSIDTEFESYCYDKGYNKNALETRYALVPDLQNNEKIKAIFMSVNKAEINKKMQEFAGNAVSFINPLPICISNIVNIKENAAIVNIEDNTAITTIIDNKIYEVDKIEDGMKTILDTISEKENSYAKAYEICKNTTIYTMEGKELLQQEENLYLEDIMPTLYNITQKVKDILEKSQNRIERIYITGTGCVINNIDLYFQEYFNNMKCEILKPYFIPENIKINIKDYIEVNSAIALAMQGLGYGIKKINFKNPTLADQLPEWLKGGKSKKKEKENTNGNTSKKPFKLDLSKNLNLSMDWKAKLDRTELWYIRLAVAALLFIIIYVALAIFLNNGIKSKSDEVSDAIEYTNSEINKIQQDTKTLNDKSASYEQMIQNLEKYSEEVKENLKVKNAIPMLLTRIMNVIPKGVTITSIENTTDSKIIIYAQSKDYDLLGFFKGSLIVDGILSPSTVVSTSGIKQDNVVKIRIEGDLP